MYEEMIYAALSGNLELMLKSDLCQGWEDAMWCYFKCVTERCVDEHLATHLAKQVACTQALPGVAPPGKNKKDYYEVHLMRTDDVGKLLRCEVSMHNMLQFLNYTLQKQI